MLYLSMDRYDQNLSTFWCNRRQRFVYSNDNFDIIHGFHLLMVEGTKCSAICDLLLFFHTFIMNCLGGDESKNMKVNQ